MKKNFANVIVLSVITLLAAACHKDKKDEVNVREINSWKIEYLGQGTVEESGQVFNCEKFRTTGTGSTWHSLYVVAAGKVNTDAQILSAMREDLAYYEEKVRTGAARKVTDLMSNADPDINTDYDALKEGIYDAFLFGYTSSGRYTGDFAKITFTVQPSAQIASYADWLGFWSAGTDKNQFEFEVARDEDGVNYKIYGWQGFSRDYPILADYDNVSGKLRMFGTDFGDYTDSGGTFHLIFTGDVQDGSSRISVEGTEDQLIATADLSEDGYSAVINGASVILTGESTPRTFCTAEYLFFTKDGKGGFYPLELDSPSFPATMTFTAESKASSIHSARSTVNIDRGTAKAVRTNNTRATTATKANSGARIKSIRKTAVQ